MPPYPFIMHDICMCVFPSTTLAFTGLAINASAISATSLTLSRPPFRMMLVKRKLFRKPRTIQWGYSFCDFKWETSVLPAQKSVNLRIITKPATVVKNKSLWVYTPVLYIYTYFYIYTYAKYVYIERERYNSIFPPLALHSTWCMLPEMEQFVHSAPDMKLVITLDTPTTLCHCYRN